MEADDCGETPCSTDQCENRTGDKKKKQTFHNYLKRSLKILLGQLRLLTSCIDCLHMDYYPFDRRRERAQRPPELIQDVRGPWLQGSSVWLR